MIFIITISEDMYVGIHIDARWTKSLRFMVMNLIHNSLSMNFNKSIFIVVVFP